MSRFQELLQIECHEDLCKETLILKQRPNGKKEAPLQTSGEVRFWAERIVTNYKGPKQEKKSMSWSSNRDKIDLESAW